LTFDSLGLSADLLRTVAEEGYIKPTPVQAAAIPHVLEGRDVLSGGADRHGQDRRLRASDPRPPP
jgi:ATP-dependent RNA helicase RhlE